MSVIDLFPPQQPKDEEVETPVHVVGGADPDSPHLAGIAICGVCENEWSCVAPVGYGHLECPKCKRCWGAFKHAVEPELSWRCNCGEKLFWLTPTGAMCRRCGVRSNQWAN
jgi:hypothetical protein